MGAQDIKRFLSCARSRLPHSEAMSSLYTVRPQWSEMKAILNGQVIRGDSEGRTDARFDAKTQLLSHAVHITISVTKTAVMMSGGMLSLLSVFILPGALRVWSEKPYRIRQKHSDYHRDCKSKYIQPSII